MTTADIERLLDFVTALAPATAAEVRSATTELLPRFGTGLDDDAAVLALDVPRSFPCIPQWT